MPRVLFPAVLHLRCSNAMLEEVKARGGGHWLRSLIAANTRPPAGDVTLPPANVSPAIASDTPAGSRRVSRKARSTRKRVSLDKRKRRKV